MPHDSMPHGLCRVLTRDGLFLDGAFHAPEADATSKLPVDVFLLVHGTGSNFYAPGVLETFTQQARKVGYPVLRINTRGHDGICSIPGPHGSVPGGATYEDISHCRDDLTAWIDFLVGQNYQRIALVGHSMGAVKSIDTLAHESLPAISCLIGVSPPRFCHRTFMTDPRAAAFRQDFQRAEALVAEGRSDELIVVRQPLPFVVTAGGFLAKYGPHDEYDIIPRLPLLSCPTLIVIGSATAAKSPAFDGLPEKIQQLAREHTQITLRTVDGADINYSTCPTTPFALTMQWLKTFDGGTKTSRV